RCTAADCAVAKPGGCAMRGSFSVIAVSSLLVAVSGGAAASAAAGDPAAAGPALRVSVYSGRHAISRDIYGMNFAPAKLERQLRLPLAAWGGDTATRYNYLLDTTNLGSDFYFINDPYAVARPGELPAGSSADRFISQNRADDAASLLTVPMIGWTPKSRSDACGFSVAKYGPQQAVDPFDADCGNGVRTNGTDITGND